MLTIPHDGGHGLRPLFARSSFYDGRFPTCPADVATAAAPDRTADAASSAALARLRHCRSTDGAGPSSAATYVGGRPLSRSRTTASRLNPSANSRRVIIGNIASRRPAREAAGGGATGGTPCRSLVEASTITGDGQVTATSLAEAMQHGPARGWLMCSIVPEIVLPAGVADLARTGHIMLHCTITAD